jgi:hypothetical protein
MAKLDYLAFAENPLRLAARQRFEQEIGKRRMSCSGHSITLCATALWLAPALGCGIVVH